MYDGQRAGFLTYGLGPAAGTISITRWETEEEFRCQAVRPRCSARSRTHFLIPKWWMAGTPTPSSVISYGKWLAAGSIASE